MEAQRALGLERSQRLGRRRGHSQHGPGTRQHVSSTPPLPGEKAEAQRGGAPPKVTQHEKSGQDLNPGLADHTINS